MKKIIFINNKEGVKSISHLNGIAEGNELLNMINAALEYIGLAIPEQDKENIILDENKETFFVGSLNDIYNILILPYNGEDINSDFWEIVNKEVKEAIKKGLENGK